jgi:hypothetical protein
MKIQIGNVFSGKCGDKETAICLNIPGVGVIRSVKDKDEKPFTCIILDKNHLKRLRKEIDKELRDEQITDME